MTTGEGSGRIVVCTYRVPAGNAAAFEALLAVHRPTLRELGLITDFPGLALRPVSGSGSVYVEVLEWATTDAAARASEVPEVIAIWEPMAALCEPGEESSGITFSLFDLVGRRG